MSVSIFVRIKVIDKYRQILEKTFVNRTNIAIHLIVNNQVRHVTVVVCDSNLYSFIILYIILNSSCILLTKVAIQNTLCTNSMKTTLNNNLNRINISHTMKI